MSSPNTPSVGDDYKVVMTDESWRFIGHISILKYSSLNCHGLR